MTFDTEKFFTAAHASFGRLSQSQVDGLQFLLRSIETDVFIDSTPAAAYLLATAKDETGDRFEPVEEIGEGRGKAYGRSYSGVDPNGLVYRAVYFGRGYVQLTWEHNYRRMSNEIFADNRLICHPELALDPVTAYRIMSRGMVKGEFTGVGLDRFIHGGVRDYVGARRIINGNDRNALIAGYAVKFESILNTALMIDPA